MIEIVCIKHAVTWRLVAMLDWLYQLTGRAKKILADRAKIRVRWTGRSRANVV